MENEFKVGNWVTVNGSLPHQFSTFTKDLPEWNKTLDYENVEMLDKSKFHIPRFDRSIVQLWKPKVGEYCWFWNNHGETPVFGKFKSMNSDCNENPYLASESWYQHEIPETANIFYDQWRKDWKYCEPFIGMLPTIIKEK